LRSESGGVLTNLGREIHKSRQSHNGCDELANAAQVLDRHLAAQRIGVNRLQQR
jgi:hypothetical protein